MDNASPGAPQVRICLTPRSGSTQLRARRVINHCEAFLQSAMDGAVNENTRVPAGCLVLNSEAMLQLGHGRGRCALRPASWARSASTSPRCRARLTR